MEARAREREGSVQARTVGITALGTDRGWPIRHRPYCLRLEGLTPLVFEEGKFSRYL
jgi:hypothetical protein